MPCKRTGRLVAVAGAELGHAQGQVAVAVQDLVEDLHVARAVHRLQREMALLGLQREHVLAELLPVARPLPEHPVVQLGRLDLDIAGAVELAADVVLHRPPQRPAVRVPEDRARRLLLDVEQVHLAAELAMVAPLRLLELVQVRVEVGLGRERRAVDALQLRVFRVATPVGARDLGQLEGADPARRRTVRATAEVEPLALVVERDRLALGDGVEQLELEALAHVVEPRPCGVAAHLLAYERQVGLHDLGHPCLDAGQVVGRERLVAEEVVVEAVLDRRADRHLGAGEQVLHGLGHDVRAVVADHRQRLADPRCGSA